MTVKKSKTPLRDTGGALDGMKKEMRRCQDGLPRAQLLQGTFLCSLMTGKSRGREELHFKLVVQFCM